uniref:Uncharacterized protein n=1 Tax=Cacopsylla melanoneura TaxID=428564 RepID=A0A8D9F138_9HEMI
MSTIFLLALLLVVFTLVQSTDRQIRQGLIVPPTGSHSANGTNALYYPSGKPAAPTKLPGGIKIPSVPLYSPGKVVTKPADSASSTNQHQEVNQPHQQQQTHQQQQQQQQQKPQHHQQQLQQHPIHQNHGLLALVNALFGTSTHNPLGVNFEHLPPNADVNIKVIQPIYSRPRQTGYIIGSRPVPVQTIQPYSSYQALSYYGSYPRRLQDTAGNDQEEETVTI